MSEEPDVPERDRVQLAGMSLLLVTGIVLLAVRRRRAIGASRRRPARMLVDAFGLSLVMLAVLFVGGLFSWPPLEILRQATFAALGLAPVAFLVGLLDARLARSDVGRLLVELRADPAQDLRGPLARALHDPSVSVAYWLPEYDGWADRDGRQVQLPGSDEARAVRLVRRSGEPVAALVFDISLEDEDELLDAVDAAAGIALENARLQAELRARLQELQGSRRRVLEASQQERQRLERDLHDGAQQRLIALSLELDELGRDRRTDAGTRTRLASLKKEVAASLAELRDVAHGLHPAVLTSHGLAVAIESLTARASVPVELTVDEQLGRLPEPVEVAAYYVVSESLTNIAKHARANRGAVVLRLSDGVLEVTVADDGIGGADTEAGSGLRGLADRVEALGGQLRIWTPGGGGTRVEAVLPCR